MADYQLYHGDCLQIMTTLEAGSVDLTVTSPPYDNLRDYGDGFCPDEFDWKSVIKELYRVTMVGGVVVWIVADATIKGSETGTSFKQALWAMECGFKLHDTMIWEKDGSPFPDKRRYKSTFEYMFVLSKGCPKSINLISDRVNKKAGQKITGTDREANGSTRESWGKRNKKRYSAHGIRYNVWKQNAEKRNSHRQKHPAVFPEQLVIDHILSWSNEGDLILDPFTGSGTTGVACARTKRKFIGMELDDTYFRLASGRIAEAYAETPPPKKLDSGKVQLSLFGE